MTDPLNDQARDAALSWIAADDADAIVRARIDGRTMTVWLGNGREIEVAVDEDLSGKGGRFVVFTMLPASTSARINRNDDAWVDSHQNELLECWDEAKAKEADDV